MTNLLFIPFQTRLFNAFYKLRCDENNIWVADRVVNTPSSVRQNDLQTI